MVESQGGSTLLIKILKRLGVCDTLSRFVQHKVHTGVLKAMKCKDTFMALSVDKQYGVRLFSDKFDGQML